MKTVADVIGVSRSNLIERLKERPRLKRIGRPPLPDDEIVAAIKAVFAETPIYGYRRNPRRSQTPSPGGRLNPTQSQEGLSGDEAPRLVAQSPCRWC